MVLFFATPPTLFFEKKLRWSPLRYGASLRGFADFNEKLTLVLGDWGSFDCRFLPISA
jgi:hypothetical protein